MYGFSARKKATIVILLYCNDFRTKIPQYQSIHKVLIINVCNVKNFMDVQNIITDA